MKNIPIAYQTFIYIIGLVLALFLLIYAASQSIIPNVYFRQSQEKMNQTFEELNDELIKAVDFNSIQNEYNEYILRSPYDIKVYNLKGEALFENISRLSPSILNVTAPAEERFDNSTLKLALAFSPKCCKFLFMFSATSLAASPALRSTDVVMPLLNTILIVWSVAELTGIPPRLP